MESLSNICCVCRFGGPVQAWGQDTHPPLYPPSGVSTASHPPGGTTSHHPAGFTSSVPHMPLLHITNHNRPAQLGGMSSGRFTRSDIQPVTEILPEIIFWGCMAASMVFTLHLFPCVYLCKWVADPFCPSKSLTVDTMFKLQKTEF